VVEVPEVLVRAEITKFRDLRGVRGWVLLLLENLYFMVVVEVAEIILVLLLLMVGMGVQVVVAEELEQVPAVLVE
jgi:hypothetical protein